MKGNRIALFSLSLAAVAAIGTGATLAYFTDSASAENVITMGHVDIEVTEPGFHYENNTITNVVPNQVIVKDPTITVDEESEDCYVRAKITMEGLTEKQQKQLLAGINVNADEKAENNKWFPGSDGYYYYNEKLKAEDSVKLFTKVTIPENWGNEVVDSSFQIVVSAEAVQADNFEPAVDEVSGMISAWIYGDRTPVTVETYRPDVN